MVQISKYLEFSHGTFSNTSKISFRTCLNQVWTEKLAASWKGILATHLKMHLTLIISILLIMINFGLRHWYILLIVTVFHNHISYFQIQTENSQILSLFLQFPHTLFHQFFNNSPLFLRILGWIFMCRWCWSSVEAIKGENRANSHCCKACPSMEVARFFTIMHLWAERSSPYIFLSTKGHLFSSIEAKRARISQLPSSKVGIRL